MDIKNHNCHHATSLKLTGLTSTTTNNINTNDFNISDSELVVMRIVWSLGATTADPIYSTLDKTYQWAPSTIKTFLARLVKKGLLTNQRVSRKYVYQATCTEDEAIAQMAQDFMHKICARKHTNVILEMIDASNLTEDDKVAIDDKIAEKPSVTEVACDCLDNLQYCSC